MEFQGFGNGRSQRNVQPKVLSTKINTGKVAVIVMNHRRHSPRKCSVCQAVIASQRPCLQSRPKAFVFAVYHTKHSDPVAAFSINTNSA